MGISFCLSSFSCFIHVGLLSMKDKPISASPCHLVSGSTVSASPCRPVSGLMHQRLIVPSVSRFVQQCFTVPSCLRLNRERLAVPSLLWAHPSVPCLRAQYRKSVDTCTNRCPGIFHTVVLMMRQLQLPHAFDGVSLSISPTAVYDINWC
ncbi:uncharacterized protein LOC117290021 isoform X2 [Asterias rubens]|uniref:uncharacterized protein LOC117290021 isoform X2 n=1 Tax=Asterias rubens TaxID=7604 RepID=UPI0014559407|nr:uncharacterized protein LOC117290021 isoform X2 [Asterias rubens]